MEVQDKAETGEKTCIKSTGNIGFGECSSIASVDVKDGKIMRIRSFPYTWKYKPEEFRPWKLEARGKVFEAPLKINAGPYGSCLQEKGLFSQPYSLSLEKGGLGP